MQLKYILIGMLMLSSTVCFSMQISFHSICESLPRKVILSDVTDAEMLIRGEENYESALELQMSGHISPAVVAYKKAFSEDENEYMSAFDKFKEHIIKHEPFEDSIIDAIKNSVISHASSSIAILCMNKEEYLEAAFWFCIAYLNGNSSAYNSFEQAMTYYNSSNQ